MATPATLHSVGARRRAPLAVLLVIPVILVVGITTTLGAAVFAHEFRYHSYGFAAVGFATALAAPVSGVGAWLARRSAANRVARLVLAQTVTFMVGVGVLVAWVAFVLFSLSHLSIGSPNAAAFGHGLRPIPIAHASCPYLAQVRDSAARAGAASGSAMHDRDPTNWRTVQGDVDSKLRRFDRALRDGASHTPAPIATRLIAVRDQVEIGIVTLSAARNGNDWFAHALPSVSSGYSSLVDASDLAGRACGFRVAPNPNIFLGDGEP